MHLPSDVFGVALVFGLGGYLAASTVGYFVYRHANRKRDDALSFGTNRNGDGVTIADAASMLKWPVTGAIAIAAACANEAAVTRVVPALMSSYGTSVSAVMPLFAATKTQAFAIGRAYQALVDLVLASGGGVAADALGDAPLCDVDVSRVPSASIAPILASVANVVGRNVTITELLRAPADLLLQDSQRSMGDRVLGALSLVNIVWAGSILLIAGLAIPALYAIAQPFRRQLEQLWNKVVWPTIVALQPVYEPICYAIATVAAIESMRYCHQGPFDTTGAMVGLTAVGLYSASWGYTTYRNGGVGAKSSSSSLHYNGGNSRALLECWRAASCVLLAAVAVPLAIVHQSTLLGYISVTSILCACGFTAFGFPLCLCIGFNSRKQTFRVAAVCLIMTLTNAALRALGVSSFALAPFTSAVAVLGTAVYFLALSIISVHDGGFGVAVYAANLAGYVTMGTLLSMPGMTNAALSWAAVEVLILSGYHIPKKDASILIVYAFAVACALYAASLYASTHPEMIAAMITGGLK